jgi:uncharacterized protein YndB with AHSA1/START domain
MKSIRRQVIYPHPPERVWCALTDPTVLAAWLMPSDIRPEVGHRFEFRTKPAPGFDGIIRCEVLVADPPRRLAYTWSGGRGGRPTLVEWRLTPVEGGTQLILEHSGFAGLSGLLLRTMLGRGWGHKLREPQHFLAVLNQLVAEETRSRS